MPGRGRQYTLSHGPISSLQHSTTLYSLQLYSSSTVAAYNRYTTPQAGTTSMTLSSALSALSGSADNETDEPDRQGKASLYEYRQC